METIKLVCPCLLGLEGLVADEMRFLGAQQVIPQNGRVFCDYSEQMLVRLNLGLRYAERVLIELGSFEAVTFNELFEGVKALPWERFLRKQDAFPVKGRSLNSKLTSIPDCQAIIKKAVVERLKMKYHLPWFEESGALHQIQFFLMKDHASILIDTSGAGLHKRGYRENATEAPIKETLAAAMANLSRVRKDTQLFDPCCGSGTLLIEGALLALNIAPGIFRRFSAEKWGCIPQTIWQEERARAQDLVRRDVGFHAVGGDIDKTAVELTMENAKKAGVSSRVVARECSLNDFKALGERGTVVCNPPYGERLLDVRAAEELYRVMGKVFPQQKGWNYTIISPDDDFESCFGRRADRRRKLYNGMLKCQLYMYFRNPK